MAKSPYAYTKHIVAFLDILGFKALVADDRLNTLFAELFQVVNQIALQDTAAMRLKGIKTAVLSDSIIISIPYGRSAFGKVQRMMFSIQRLLIEKQVLTRGAICVGNLYHEGNIVFGPALVDAYLLQEHSAVYPRCIIEPHTLRECLKTHRGEASRHTALYDFPLDADGFYFYDFFWNDLTTRMYIDGKYGTDNTMGAIEAYRSFIVANLESRHHPRVLAKYAWLKNQFNRTMGAITADRHYGIDLLDLCIETPELIDRSGNVIDAP